jgi:hypothetical protein
MNRETRTNVPESSSPTMNAYRFSELCQLFTDYKLWRFIEKQYEQRMMFMLLIRRLWIGPNLDIVHLYADCFRFVGEKVNTVSRTSAMIGFRLFLIGPAQIGWSDSRE